MLFAICLCLIYLRLTLSREYDLDPFPKTMPVIAEYRNSSYNKHIPRNIWIAVKDEKDPLPGHLNEFFARNPEWTVKVCDNLCKDRFINTTFENTSIKWAYYMINPLVGASRADIWRYCVLYTFGGMYLDDDSDIKTKLDEVITPEDHLIMSEEGSSSLGDCYNPTYHLSDAATFKKYKNFTNAKHYHGMNKDNIPIFFHDHTLINWAIFVAPRHPLFERTLRNIVEIVRSEYLRKSHVHITRFDVKWKYVMCTTGFVLTYSMRELELENSMPPELFPRISVNNFREYKGNVKAIWTGADPSHYMKAMQHKNGPHLLREYAPIKIEQIVDYLEGRSVMGDAGKEIYLIYNGTRCSFTDYTTFLDLKFTDKGTKHVADNILLQIPVGRPVVEFTEAEKKRLIENNELHQLHLHHSPSTSHSQQQQQHHSNSGSNSNNNNNVNTQQVVVSHNSDSSKAPNKPSLQYPYPYNNIEPKDIQLDYSLKIPATVSSSLSSSDKETMHTYLMNVTRKLNNVTVLCFGDDYAGSRDDFINNVHSNIVGQQLPVMVYPFCARTFQLGNTLGYYLNDLSCADIAGANFIAVHKEFNLLDPDSLVTHGDNRLTFFNYLPDLVIHPHMKSINDVKHNMKTQCQCLQYCWENNEAPWLKRVNLIRNYLKRAIDAYLDVSEGMMLGTRLNKTTDLSTLPIDTPLPLIPNVTIQYRCGDNIGFGRTRYGLLPFSVYTPSRIPVDIAEYIYVIADSPYRSVHSPYSSRCETILQHFHEHLKKQFPKAKAIIIKRGGDAFLDYVRIVYSQIVICSASTFCLWPAITNSIGKVYFPLTPLIAKAISNETAPKLTSNFYWIGDKEMIKDFRKYRPWSQLINDLESL